jgi:hypothetical protein
MNIDSCSVPPSAAPSVVLDNTQQPGTLPSHQIIENQDSLNFKIPDSIIDSALLAALRDPRERLGLLKLEQTLVDFMERQPQDTYLDVGGAFNSVIISPSLGVIGGSNNQQAGKSATTFQRCILHRLADRFQITRDSNADGTIRLFKLGESKVPSRLLLNVDSSEYSLQQSLEKQLTIEDNPTFHQPPQKKNQGKKNRKMKIMKRSDSSPAHSLQNKNTSASQKKKNFSEKEKAYAEARARIFQREQLSATSAVFPLHNSVSDPSLYTAPLAVPSTTFSTEEELAPTGTDSTKPSKATFRDRRQEEADPDFQRGGSMMVPQAYIPPMPQEYYNNPTNDYYGYFNGPPGGAQQRGTLPTRVAAPQQQRPPQVIKGGSGRGGYYYPQQQTGYPQSYGGDRGHADAPVYHRTSTQNVANVHSLEDFPSLR